MRGCGMLDEKFEMEFNSEEEVESAFDELVEAIKDDVQSDEEKVTVLSVQKLKQIEFAYATLKYLLKGKSAKLSYKLYEPFKTMGSISVEAKSIEFDKPELFARVSEFASNTEVYPLAKNMVRLTFTFHGLTVPIE
jgi:hypothetical protein